MSNPSRPIPDAQRQAFGRALCERLGLDPSIVSENFEWSVVGDDDLSPVTFTAYLPSEELVAMFNEAGRA